LDTANYQGVRIVSRKTERNAKAEDNNTH
jgi:hypothetical protein